MGTGRTASTRWWAVVSMANHRKLDAKRRGGWSLEMTAGGIFAHIWRGTIHIHSRPMKLALPGFQVATA